MSGVRRSCWALIASSDLILDLRKFLSPSSQLTGGFSLVHRALILLSRLCISFLTLKRKTNLMASYASSASLNPRPQDRDDGSNPETTMAKIPNLSLFEKLDLVAVLISIGKHIFFLLEKNKTRGVIWIPFCSNALTARFVETRGDFIVFFLLIYWPWWNYWFCPSLQIFLICSDFWGLLFFSWLRKWSYSRLSQPRLYTSLPGFGIDRYVE